MTADWLMAVFIVVSVMTWPVLFWLCIELDKAGRPEPDPASFSDPQAAASALSRHGHNKARAKIRAKCDEMNAALGRPPIVWL